MESGILQVACLTCFSVRYGWLYREAICVSMIYHYPSPVIYKCVGEILCRTSFRLILYICHVLEGLPPLAIYWIVSLIFNSPPSQFFIWRPFLVNNIIIDSSFDNFIHYAIILLDVYFFIILEMAAFE